MPSATSGISNKSGHGTLYKPASGSTDRCHRHPSRTWKVTTDCHSCSNEEGTNEISFKRWVSKPIGEQRIQRRKSPEWTSRSSDKGPEAPPIPAEARGGERAHSAPHRTGARRKTTASSHTRAGALDSQPGSLAGEHVSTRRRPHGPSRVRVWHPKLEVGHRAA